MKWRPTENAQKGRGNYFFKKEGGVTTIWFGDPKTPEAEYVHDIHDDWIDDMIATLKLIKQKG